MSDVASPRAGFLVEWYQPDLTTQGLDEALRHLTDAACAMSADGDEVQLVLTLAAHTDEVLYGVFGGASAMAVLNACRRAGLPADRISGDVTTRICTLPQWG